MDNFQIIYKILKALEAAMDLPEFDIQQIGPETLKISQERWARYMEMIADMGLVKGIKVFSDFTGQTHVECLRVRITMKGLEYLTENSIMQRMYKAAKGVVDLIPGV